VSRRKRAVAFLVAALLAAACAAAIADSYGSRVVRGYGELRPVLVAVKELRRGRPIDPALAADGLELRRVPLRFVPPGALAAHGEAIGLAPVAAIPAGAYLLASQLRSPQAIGPVAVLGSGRRPVEIAVSGAGALAVGGQPVGGRVDVVVTTEPTGSGSGRTYLAAEAVPLLGLAPGADGPGPGGTAAAMLGLTRRQALRLIAAQSFARQVTILPAG
jgi:Flp pilus assembly protein CpaB